MLTFESRLHRRPTTTLCSLLSTCCSQFFVLAAHSSLSLCCLLTTVCSLFSTLCLLLAAVCSSLLALFFLLLTLLFGLGLPVWARDERICDWEMRALRLELWYVVCMIYVMRRTLNNLQAHFDFLSALPDIGWTTVVGVASERLDLARWRHFQYWRSLKLVIHYCYSNCT